MVRASLLISLLLLQCISCSWRPSTKEYQMQYAYLEEQVKESAFIDSEYYIVFLVDAKHFDYTDSVSFLRTFVKHPDSASKECTIGHAWILLKGLDDSGKSLVIEGGHSGELGIDKPRYADGIFHLIQSKDLNPIKYLWEPLNDGFFQKGNGGHMPTFAAKVNLTKEQFKSILNFIHPNVYPYKMYSLTKRQCVTFLVQIAALLDLEIKAESSVPIHQTLKISKSSHTLWTDPAFSVITFPSPEGLEHCLIKLVQYGKAECVLDWYNHLPKDHIDEESVFRRIHQFPSRFTRFLMLKS